MRLRQATPGDRDAIVALQNAAYAQNRAIMGVEPLPLLADYDDILASSDVWLAEDEERLVGVLILQLRPDDLLIWSVATSPVAQNSGLGKMLLAQAETRARDAGRNVLRLYTNEVLTKNVAWYGRHGYAIERIEQMSDRRAVHMKKTLPKQRTGGTE